MINIEFGDKIYSQLVGIPMVLTVTLSLQTYSFTVNIFYGQTQQKTFLHLKREFEDTKGGDINRLFERQTRQ